MCTVWRKPTRPSLTIVSKLGVSRFVFSFAGCAALKTFFVMLQHAAAIVVDGGGGIGKDYTAGLTSIAN
ncbi:hypothetical protein GCM10011382_27670 [Vreelandella lutescens]|uniref:Uncharacterized protein n=1 Tax=Vreelandella lutescens TaxID=1602943 RepID=A0ABQ1PEI4_9GAMM|nr:hypothetical protein GCM10011382_27670 [Halomonas lutescens]